MFASPPAPEMFFEPVTEVGSRAGERSCCRIYLRICAQYPKPKSLPEPAAGFGAEEVEEEVARRIGGQSQCPRRRWSSLSRRLQLLCQWRRGSAAQYSTAAGARAAASAIPEPDLPIEVGEEERRLHNDAASLCAPAGFRNQTLQRKES